MRILSTLLLLFGILSLHAQDEYTYWAVGDTSDASTAHEYGVVLAGGNTDHDNAMRWMLERANGGDVVILRASGSDGYNDYFFSELGIDVHSVETIRFDGLGAASDPFVIERIRQAEVLFFAGGDQFDYYQYWKDNAIEEAINYLINDKQATVGGTSAGMAILGGAYYAPSDLGVLSSEALSDPFDPYMDVIGADDFINIPLLERVITDTHYSDRERQGRHFAFLARLAAQWQDRSFGIASNDYVAVAVDEMGIARVFGDYPEFDDFAFFLQANCQPDFLPEMMEVGTPLTWNRGESAVKAYKVPGTWEGDYTFDLNDWQTGSGGSWENWFVQDGSLEIRTEVSDDCADILTNTEEWMQDDAIQIFPNPVREALTLNVPVDTERVQLFNAQGQMVHQSKLLTNLIDVSSLQSGTYTLVIDTPAGPFRQRFVKID